MTNANIKAIITAEDQATPVIKKFGKAIGDSGDNVGKLTSKLKANVLALGAMTVGAGLALDKITAGIYETINAANRQQAAFMGLASISKAFGQSSDEATVAAKRLSRDGLMTVTDAATGLKNLMAAGFNLPSAIKLMERFKDSAAFGRQASLNFGQAVTSATEGIKNGNSILVDNAGVTKNLSIMLEEAGYNAQDLMKASTDAGVRQAIFNGILKETTPMLGDSAKLSQSFAGEQARLAASIENTKAKLGEALQPALSKILEAIAPVVKAIGDWVEKNPQLASTLTIATVGFLAMAVAIGAVATAFVVLDAATGGLALVIMAALAGIATAAALIITNWDKVKAFIISAWTAISTTIFNVFNAITSFIREKVDYIKNNFWETIGFIIGFFATLPFKIPFLIGLMISKVVGMIASINWASVWSGLWNFLSGLWDRIADGFKRLINNIKNINWGDIGRSIANSVIGLIEGAINGALKGLPGAKSIHLPRFASGVTNFAGGLAVVGERGPEVVQLPQGSNVIPNNRIGGFGGNINLSVNVGVYAGTEQEKRKVAKELFNALGDIASSKNMTVAELLA